MGTPFARRATIGAAVAAAMLMLTAATALAAPILQPGVTSAPGMSGVCTNCHVYATAPVVTPPVVKPPVVKPPVVNGEHERDGEGRAAHKRAKHVSHHHVRRGPESGRD